MIDDKIWLSSPHMGGAELKYINEAFEQNWIAPLGPNVNNFETQIAHFLDNEKPINCAALISGTAALHLALRMLDVRLGDVVIVQSFTFCGSTNPVSYLNAEIIFVDSEIDTWNMCPKSLEKALEENKNKNIKAIIPVHLYGMPAKIDEIQEIAKKFNVPIIEDAAEALGSKYKGMACGTFGLMSALSFNGNKIITTSGGGALVSRFNDFVTRARYFATQARDEAPHYQHSQIGYNYRMSNIVAGIGLGQMLVLKDRVLKRRENNFKYKEFFKNFDGVTFQSEPSSDYYSNYWLTTILIDPQKTNGLTREDVRLALAEANIESRPLWKPMHLQPVYKGAKFYGEGLCVNLFEDGLCLPSGSNLTDNDFDRIFNVLSKLF